MGAARRPRVVVAPAVAPEVLARLRAACDVDADVATPLPQRAAQADGLLVGPTERVDAALLTACTRLRIVASLAVGTNNIDLAACATRGITVTNAPDVLTETTADFGLALLLATARNLSEAERELRTGAWQGWAVGHHAGADVHGSRLGIVGMGRIGQAIARRAVHGFGMRLLYANRNPLSPEVAEPLGAQWRGLDALLQEADHVLLTVPYSAATHHLIGARELALMPPHATLVNLARGGVVDDAALAAALRQGRLAGAALDVFEGEPRVHPELLTAPRCTLTPHIASASRATRTAMAALAADNLLAVLAGGPPITPVRA